MLAAWAEAFIFQTGGGKVFRITLVVEEAILFQLFDGCVDILWKTCPLPQFVPHVAGRNGA